MKKQIIDGPIFRQVWDNAFDAMRLVNGDGNILMVNDAFCRMVDLTREKLIGKPISVVYKEGQREHIHRKLVERFRSDVVEEDINRLLTLWNDKEVCFEVSNTFIQSDDYGLLLLSIFRDITDKKKAESEVRKYADKLQSLIATKDKFFSLISHDLRGPFQSLLGLTDLITEELDTLSKEELSEYVNSLKRTLTAQYNLLENLLSWSRLQTGQVPLEPEEVMLEEEISDVLAVMEASFRNKSITVKKEVPAEMKLFADKNMLKSILQNLLSNAIKFTPEKGEIVIGAGDAGSRHRIYVRDNGVGMDEEMKKKVFDITRNYSKRGTKGEKGTGLGLVICKEMAELQGGTLEVESEPGQGSTFYLTLPKKS